MSPVWHDFLITQGAIVEDGILLNFPGSNSKAADDIITDLSHLDIVEISGNEAEDFLHGQFTTNIKQLSNNHCQFSAWCNSKGQVKATFFIYRHEERFIILLPAELKESFLKQLQMYILRADVKLADKSDEFVRVGLQANDATLFPDLIESHPEQQGEVMMDNDLHCLQLPLQGDASNAHRTILIGSLDRQISLWNELVKHATPVGTAIWELLDIQATYPWITTQTTQKFLPQMLNLDLMDGLDYQKGCYPGHEIIARLHFRGQLKRSLYLATCALESCPVSGDLLYANDDEQSVGTVINVQASQDKYYLLAVIENDSIDNTISLRGSDGTELKLCQLPPAPVSHGKE